VRLVNLAIDYYISSHMSGKKPISLELNDETLYTHIHRPHMLLLLTTKTYHTDQNAVRIQLET